MLLRRLRWFWQRGRHGWSELDAWGLHDYLESVIGASVVYLREIAHGHPADLTYEAWLAILDEIAAGMKDARIYATTGKWEEGGEERFNRAMRNLHDWWFHLWD